MIGVWWLQSVMKANIIIPNSIIDQLLPAVLYCY